MAVLMHYGLRSHLLGAMPPTIAMDEAKALDWRTKDERVLGDLILSISTPLRGIVRNVGTAREAWEKVLAVYETKLASNVLHLKKELYQCRMEDVTAKDAMQTHISRMRNLIDRLASVGTDITAEDAGVQLYLSLPDTYSHISAALSLKPVDELTFDVVASVLLQEERRLQGLASATLSATAKAESALAATSLPAGNSNPLDKAPRPKCTFCNKKGHTDTVCYRKHGYPVGHPLHGKEPNQGPHAHFAYSAMVVNDSLPPTSSQSTRSNAAAATSEWLIDSGASQHICASADWFASYQPVTGKSVVIANGQRIPAVGSGDIHVDVLLNGRVATGVFRDVLHAPAMAYNLLSVTRMTEAGLSVSFSGKDCIIHSQDGQVIGRASRKAGTSSMYSLHARPHATAVKADVAVEETVEVRDYVAVDGLLPNRHAIALRTASVDTELTAEAPRPLSNFSGPQQLALEHSHYYAALADSQSDHGQSLPRYSPWQLAHLRMGHLHSKALARLPDMATDAEWVRDGVQAPIFTV